MVKISDGYEGSTEYAVMMEMVNHIYPKCFHDCFEKMLDHGLRYALKPTKVGLYWAKRKDWIGIRFSGTIRQKNKKIKIKKK